MNEFRLRATGFIVNETGLRISFPGLLPYPLTPEAIDAAGADPVIILGPPAISFGQSAVRDGVRQLDNGSWVQAWRIDAPPDEQLTSMRDQIVAQKWEAIKAERDGARKEGGVQVGSKWYHSDTDSRQRWMGLKDSARDILAAGGNGASPITLPNVGQIMWKTRDGSYQPVTVQLALDVVQAVKVLDGALFLRAEQHLVMLKAAYDPSAYDIITGWPVRYGE